MQNLQEFLDYDQEENGNLIFGIGMFQLFSSFSDRGYAEICGGFYEGVYQWVTHNVDMIDECENAKYKGWTIDFENGRQGQMFIPIWVLNAKVNDWKHAKNMFCKYLKRNEMLKSA